MNDFLGILFIGVTLALAVLAIFIAPLLAIALLPLWGVYILTKKYKDNPVRKEKEAQAYNQLIYQQAQNTTFGALDEVQIQARLNSKLRKDLPEHIRFHIVALCRATLDIAKVTFELPPPPPIANSIEGGRWRDEVSALGTRSPAEIQKAVDVFAEIARKVASIVPKDISKGSFVPAKYFVNDEGELVQDIIQDIFESDLLKPIQERLEANLETQKQVMPEDSKSDSIMEDYLAGTPLAKLLYFLIPFAIPTKLRPSHHTIIAPSGSGKTTLFESMIVDDLKEDCCIVVIDSQRGLITKLAEHIDPDRIILVDPATCVPALNLFAQVDKDDIARGRTLAMFEYIFSSKGVDFTPQQSLLYRGLSRLCMAIPGASLATMRDMCQPMATATPEYAEHIAKLDKNTRSFFTEYNLPKNGRYDETRQAVLTRLQIALDNPIFETMLGASTMPLNILDAIEAGKVILVNTDSDRLQDTAKLLGRIFAGLVMQAVQSRLPGVGKQVYMYIDEFGQDYAQDSDMLLKMFTQTRKYNLGMVVCYQHLKQLTPDLKSAIASSTAIRMASMVSDEDENAIAGQLRTTVPELRALPPYTFMAYFRGIGTMPWKVEDGKLEALPKNSPAVMEALRERMRQEYGEEPVVPPQKPAPPEEEEFVPAF